MEVWRPHMSWFLDWLLRRDGLGDYLHKPACACCQSTVEMGGRLFRCLQCGEFLQCQSCLLDRHRLNPLHSVKVCNNVCYFGSADRLFRSGTVNVGPMRRCVSPKRTAGSGWCTNSVIMDFHASSRVSCAPW
jgi:hypothetical protein